MEADLHSISYTAAAPYYTLGSKNAGTQAVWITCHGIGQRSKFFVRKFEGLLPSDHYLIAPQGLSRFYMHGKYERVGASWMTKEYREMEIANQGNYLDEILLKELGVRPWERYELNLLGFSQGVATISRWAISRRIPFRRLVLWAGGFPHEVHTKQESFLLPDSEIWGVVGDKDPYLTEEKLQLEHKRLRDLFGTHLHLHSFVGEHEIKPEVLTALFFSS